jgi:hypothetical protein
MTRGAGTKKKWGFPAAGAATRLLKLATGSR